MILGLGSSPCSLSLPSSLAWHPDGLTIRRAGPFEPTGQHERREVEVAGPHPSGSGRSARALATDAALLANRLYQIKHKVPRSAVKELQKVTIWVEEREPHHPCMAYHPDAGWLREHDMNPDKARCVEIANAANFLTWTREQPWMVLHELAHAYHHQTLDRGFENPDVAGAYREARNAKTYETVLHWDGRETRHYATTNPMEYFAEATEAFFGANDFYPFVRAELKKHDPAVDVLLKKLWGGDRP
ncbi:MAG: hypothetical protein U0794_19295 [Isosphaeraceae bacterium]